MRDLKVLSFANGVLTPKIDTNALFGTPALVQRIIKTLLTDQGSDRFEPEFGGGLRKALPSTYDDRQINSVKMGVTAAILVTEKLIKSEDATVKSNPDEQLDQLHLRDLTFDPSRSSWVVDISLRSKAGTVGNVSVGV